MGEQNTSSGIGKALLQFTIQPREGSRHNSTPFGGEDATLLRWETRLRAPRMLRKRVSGS